MAEKSGHTPQQKFIIVWNALFLGLAIWMTISAAGYDSEMTIALAGTRTPDNVQWLAIATGVLALAALHGAAARKAQWLRTYFYVSIVTVVCGFMLALVMVTNGPAFGTSFSDRWSLYRDTPEGHDELAEFQLAAGCCGFHTVADRPVDPCPHGPLRPNGTRAQTTGCEKVLMKRLVGAMGSLGSWLMLFMLLNLVGMYAAWSTHVTMTEDVKEAADDEERKRLREEDALAGTAVRYA
eukprot:PLAT7385.1.p2 GENE.PLAT7385.1~~PLAT7385.1.p2  ORF type:complete len:247 (-),score=81.52 PLAT7385.1:152-865(-)